MENQRKNQQEIEPKINKREAASLREEMRIGKIEIRNILLLK